MAGAGLETMYTDSTGAPSFFQPIEFVSSSLSEETALRFLVRGQEQDLVLGEDFVMQEILGSGADRTVSEAPVLLGYGIEEPEDGWNDYAGLDVAGRIGIVVAGAPTRDGQPVLPEEKHQLYNSFAIGANELIQSAMSHGLTTLVVIPDSAAMSLWGVIARQADRPSTRPSFVEAEAGDVAPAMSELVFLKPEAAVDFLSGTGLDPLTGTGSYRPGPLENVQVEMNTRHDVLPGYASPNVVGLLPGSDPVLKEEYIVVTAHLDHVGVRNGEVYNGADDNASGSAAVLEAAEALARSSLKRSVIFVLLTAEEKGLHGSMAFAARPPVPIENVVLNINLDMVGRNSPDFPDVLLAMGSENGRQGLLQLIRDVNEGGIGAPLDWRLNEGDDPHAHVQRSDQLAFMQRGVPAILITRGFMGPDYHEPTDDPETINYEKVLHATRLTYGLVLEAANRGVLDFGSEG
jgi:hypothetical protein